MRRLDLNNKKLHLAILQFFYFNRGKLLIFGKSAFSNIIWLQIALPCKKVSHELTSLEYLKTIFDDFEFFDFSGKKGAIFLNFENFRFSNIIWLQITVV